MCLFCKEKAEAFFVYGQLHFERLCRFFSLSGWTTEGLSISATGSLNMLFYAVVSNVSFLLF